MNDLIWKLIERYLTDENIQKAIDPYKKELVAKFEAYAKASPEIWDDFAVKVLKAVLGVV